MKPRPWLLATLLLAAPCAAQVRPAVAISLGGSRAMSSRYTEPTGLSFELLASLRFARGQAAGWSLAVARERSGGGFGDSACSVPCPVTVGAFHSVVGLLGHEWSTPTDFSFRPMIGAGMWSAGTTDGWHGTTWQGRIDAMTPTWGILGGIMSARLSTFPHVDGRTLKQWSAGVGLALR